MPGPLLIVVLAMLLLAVLPSWPYSRTWGYYPSGVMGLILAFVACELPQGTEVARQTLEKAMVARSLA